MARLAAMAAVLTAAGAANAQVPVWLREFGGFGDESADALLSVEPNRVFMAGGVLGSLFSPNLGGDDVYLAWFDDAGNLVGGVQFGTNGQDDAAGLAHAEGGDVYVGGFTGGSLGGPPVGGGDVWIARCDSVGDRRWVRQFGSTEIEYVFGMCSDSTGGVFIGGPTMGAMFGPSAGWHDAWIARFNAEGAMVWGRQFGTPGLDFPSGLASDGSGGFFIGGSTTGGLFGQNTGNADAWIGRFDAGGRIIWGRQLGTPQSDLGRALSTDGRGGAFFVGETAGVLAGGAPGGVWVANYDAAGNRASIMQFGSGVGVTVGAVGWDGSGGAFVAGGTSGSLGGLYAGQTDAWIAHIQDGQTVAWIDQLGTALYDSATALALAGPGRVFTTGITNGNLAPGGGGNWDAWLARYDICYPDCNADGSLTVVDFGCFQTKFIAADPYADCNADGVLTVQDFGCFQTKFVVGCP